MAIEIKFIQGAGSLSNNTPVTIYTVPSNRRAKLLWNHLVMVAETTNNASSQAEAIIRASGRNLIHTRGVASGSSSNCSAVALGLIGADRPYRYQLNQNYSVSSGQTYEEILRRLFSNTGGAVANEGDINAANAQAGQLYQDADLQNLYLQAADTIQLYVRAFVGTFNFGQYAYGMSIIEEF